MNYDKLNEFLETYNDKISAVVVVDLYGQGVNLKQFKELCDNYKVKLIVDAAQSFELFYDRYHQIDYCDSLALSFNPLKNLGAMGNAGAVVSKNYNVETLKKYTQQGKLDLKVKLLDSVVKKKQLTLLMREVLYLEMFSLIYQL
jgi:dTDP-4-amino-4,6-dideoxygalactose transaminase